MILTDGHFKRLTKFILERSGNIISVQNKTILEMKLVALLDELMIENIDEIMYKIHLGDEYIEKKIIETITIHETRWFRDRTFSKLINDVLMPKWVEMLRESSYKSVNIWSSASSSGQEIYSTIILINEYLDTNNITDIKLNRFHFYASDLSNSVLNRAKNGIYSKYEISRGCKDPIVEKYFDEKDGGYVFKEKFRHKVCFEQQNLLEPIKFRMKFDYVMCRYVLIYFERDTKLEVLENISDKIKPGGGLMLGGSEMYLQYAKLFDKVNIGVGNYYVKK